MLPLFGVGIIYVACEDFIIIDLEEIKMEKDINKMKYHLDRLNQGEIYWDKKNKIGVEFSYMGQTGYAIVCEPGDSGGGMQSHWGIDPDNLEKKVNGK